MLIYLNVSAKYKGVWHKPGETLEVSNDVGKIWTDGGGARFLGFRCPSCKTVITGDTIAEAQRKYRGHRSGHGKERLKKEKEERIRKAKEKKGRDENA